MTVYGIRGLKRREEARELLALAAGEEWGLSALPETARLPGSSSTSATAERWLCAPWTAARWGWISRW